MKKYLDASDKINSIRLELRHPVTKTKKWVLVEGENDVKIYGKLLNDKLVAVEQVHGGIHQLIKSVTTLILETNRVLGIRDADFLNLYPTIEPIKALFLTDYHDIEMLMISSDNVMNSLFNEFLNRNIDYKVIRKQILNSISFLGVIRWYNEIHNLELNFKALSINNFFNPKDFSFNKNACILELNNRSSNKRRSISLDEIIEFLPSEINLYNVCNGHDFEKALSSYISEHSGIGVDYKLVGKSLRISYSISDFKKTKLYASLVDWELKHSLTLFDY